MSNRLSLVLLIGAAPFLSAEAQVAHSRSAPSDSVEKRALQLMEEIVPRAPLPTAAIRIAGQGEHGFWGPLFGDDRVAALVAVSPVRKSASPNAPPVSAQLCLLRWDGRWRFQQWVGEVPASGDARAWDWTLKRRKPSEGYFVLSHLALYPPDAHDSWHCDPATHTVVPTGWRKDAIPSLAGDTITFITSEKPGYVPETHSMHHFDRVPGNLIASWQQEAREGITAIYRVDRPDPATGKLVTWRLWEKKPVARPVIQWAVNRSVGDAKPQERTEDATIDLSWKQDTSEWQVVPFLIGRLTGLGAKAITGAWESDWSLAPNSPEKAMVRGLPEAVAIFSWPPTPP